MLNRIFRRKPFTKQLMADDVINAADRKQISDHVEEGIRPVRTGRPVLVGTACVVAVTALDFALHAWIAAAVGSVVMLLQFPLLAKFIRDGQRHAYLLGWQAGLEHLRRELDE